MYKAVVQTVLLYMIESWVVTEAMLKVLEGFHHQVVLRISWMSAQQVGEEGCRWSLLAEALEATGMWLMKEYIRRWQANIAGYITNFQICELCIGSERMMGSSRLMQWWNQDLNPEY